jgi:hypothetical protein
MNNPIQSTKETKTTEQPCNGQWPNAHTPVAFDLGNIKFCIVCARPMEKRK